MQDVMSRATGLTEGHFVEPDAALGGEFAAFQTLKFSSKEAFAFTANNANRTIWTPELLAKHLGIYTYGLMREVHIQFFGHNYRQAVEAVEAWTAAGHRVCIKLPRLHSRPMVKDIEGNEGFGRLRSDECYVLSDMGYEPTAALRNMIAQHFADNHSVSVQSVGH